ncbi:CobW family GTP-binding protein [Paenibacillus hexagrammi]|uniref:GTP-binding protein n=1 Tax=Paenibacillus hexagrammi TaxID=2908839 RepID=A0ABY3SP45_9BACL|nr:CobW family GTP-binding protein [Paenibacillus sp. YPD9-1]UJF35828.1 GTP-binding protein [Paenibacillus sp. YPD9-1]
MKVPVIVLSGFLGSGKTTLLMQMLNESKARGLRPGVLMNELGRQDVDGRILDEHNGAAIERLLDGCVCCSKKEELADSLKLLIKQQPDLIYIELTGVANPEEIADALTEPGLLESMSLQQIITVLDSEHTLEYNSIFSSDKELVITLRKQMEAADYVLINKADLVSSSTLDKIEKHVRKYNDKAVITRTVHSRFDLSKLLEPIKAYARTGAAASSFRILKSIGTVSHSPAHQQPSPSSRSFSRIRTVTLPFPSSKRLSKAQLERFMSEWSKHLLRAKGYVSLVDQPFAMLMQFAGKRTYWEPSEFQGAPYVVCIGIDLDQQRLEAEWKHLFT